MLLALPGVEESTSWGAPSFKVKRKIVAVKIARDVGELGDVLMLRIDLADRDLLMDAAPDVFFTAPHYAGYPCVLVRLRTADAAQLQEVIAASWRYIAPTPARRR